MRIGLNLLYLIPGEVGGVETYAIGLLGGLAQEGPEHEYVVFLNREAAEFPLPLEGPRVRRVVCPVRAAHRPVRYAYEQLRLPRLVRRHGVEVLHSLSYVAPLRSPCPSVVTVHDLNYKAFGEEMPASKRWALSVFVAGAVARCDAVIAVSAFTESELRAAFGPPEGKVAVIHEAPRPYVQLEIPPREAEETRSALGLTPPYLLAFASRSANKNLPRLVRAFARARERGGLAHQLVLVGHRPPGLASGGDSGVVATGFLGDRALHAVLAGADALVLPSTYEGFGLPVLEAMALGVPVVASRAASLPEVAGTSALYFDPYAEEELAGCLERIARDAGLRASLRAGGSEWVARFSWRKAARETLAVYASVIAARPGATAPGA